jgi:hypothetical protein
MTTMKSRAAPAVGKPQMNTDSEWEFLQEAAEGAEEDRNYGN